MSDYVWPHRHLLGIEELSAQDIRFVLQTAHGLEGVSTRSVKKVPALRGKVVANLFFEDSTRTSSSFQLAAQRLSADVLDFKGKGSSVSKGETLVDTARNIEAMKIDLVVIRHKSAGAPHFLTRCIDSAVVNAGDGAHEHPTQALLDAYTIADMATWPWYGALAKGLLYESAEFLQVHEYTHVNRWADEISERPAAQRGRMVNRVFGEPSSQLPERHDASDFELRTMDKLQAEEASAE